MEIGTVPLPLPLWAEPAGVMGVSKPPGALGWQWLSPAGWGWFWAADGIVPGAEAEVGTDPAYAAEGMGCTEVELGGALVPRGTAAGLVAVRSRRTGLTGEVQFLVRWWPEVEDVVLTNPSDVSGAISKIEVE